MRNRKRHKTIDNYSVSQLLDDFLSPDTLDTSRPSQDIDDDEYIRLMLKKDALMKLERTKREAHVTEHDEKSSPRSDTIDDNLRQRFFPDMSENPLERESPPEEKEKLPEKKELPPDNRIVEEILDSIMIKDVSGLAARMKEAVDLVQDEMGTSDAERKLVEALEKYKKPTETSKKKSDSRMYNDNVLVLKRCQNCHFCIGERNSNGSVWCLCSNPDRSTDVEIDDSWVKSKLNLPCWKDLQD